jgi:tetratricopeptide (TPR) repeat protein
MRPVFETLSLTTLYKRGEFAALVAECEEVLSDSRNRYGPTAIEVAHALEDLGRAYYAMANYSAAASCLRQALSIETERRGRYSEECAVNLSNQGRLNVLMGRHAAAESCLDQAMDVMNRLPAGQQAGYSSILMNRAFLHAERNDIRAAERLFLTAAKCRLHEYGACHPKYANVFNELGRLYWKTGRALASERAIAKAIRIYRRASYTENGEYAQFLIDLCCVKAHCGKLAEARNCSLEALNVLRRVCSPCHPAVTRLEKRLSALGISRRHTE